MAEQCKEAKVIVTSGNDWKIVAKKFLYGWGAAVAPITLSYSIDFLQNEDLSSLPIWFLALVPFITGALLAAQNAWNHRQKISFVTDTTTVTR